MWHNEQQLWKSGQLKGSIDKVGKGEILIQKVAEILSGVSGAEIPYGNVQVTPKKFKHDKFIADASSESNQMIREKSNAEEDSMNRKQNHSSCRSVFNMFNELMKHAELKPADLLNISPIPERAKRRKGRPPTTISDEVDNPPSPSMLADPNFVCLNRMTKYRFVKNRRGTNNVAVFVDDEHVRLYRPTNHSKYCAYYRCSTCDRLYQERGEGPRPTFKIVNGIIRCSGSGHYHSEDCKPLSCVEMRVKELDYEARLQISQGLLKPREAWSNARMQWMLDNDNQINEADGFPSWQAVRSSYNRRKRSFKKTLANGLTSNQNGGYALEYLLNSGKDCSSAEMDEFAPDSHLRTDANATMKQNEDHEVFCVVEEKMTLSEMFSDSYKALVNIISSLGDVELPEKLDDAKRTAITNILEKIRRTVSENAQQIAFMEFPESPKMPESGVHPKPGTSGHNDASAVITLTKNPYKRPVKCENEQIKMENSNLRGQISLNH